MFDFSQMKQITHFTLMQSGLWRMKNKLRIQNAI